MNKDLEALVKKVSAKRTWIRKELETFFDTWAEETKGISRVFARIAKNDCEFESDYYLMTGRNDVMLKIDGHWHNWSDDEFIYNGDFNTVKEIVRNLKTALDEISNKLKEEEKEVIEFPKW
jgi:hypothetical protein